MFLLNPYVYDTENLIGPNTAMNLSFNDLKSMLVEGNIPLTDVALDGDAVGCVYDQTVNGLILRSGSAATNNPVLGSDATRNNFVTFDGTNDRLEVLSSLGFFNTLWQAVPKGTICIWFKMNGGDAAAQYLIGNTNLTTAAGFQIFRGGTNTIVTRAGNGAIKWTYTSTATVVAADGWRGLIVSVNGTGASAGRFILMNSSGTILEDATFSVSAGTTVNAQNRTLVGARVGATPDLFLNGSISAIIVENFPVTDNLIAQFKAYNPGRTSTEFTPILQYLLDMSNNTFIYSDAAGTTQANNGDAVRVIRSSVVGNFNLVGEYGALRRIWQSASAGASAIYRTAQINGNATIEFDGVDDNYDMALTNVNLFEELAGKNTLFIIMKNDDVTFGSHPFSGSNYIVLTGSGYSSGAGFTYPYFIVHPEPDGGASVGQESENAGVDDYKVIAYRRNGSALSAWNGDKTKNTGTSTDVLYMTDMGENHASPGANWWMDGHIAYVAKYNGVMTDAQVEAEIDRLKTRFGL